MMALEKKASVRLFIKELLQWVEAILLAVIIAFVIRAFVFEPVKVIGSSMEETLHSGERLLVYKLGYKISPPKRGDIVVLKTSETNIGENNKLSKLPVIGHILFPYSEIDYIKRVVALPEDRIDIRDGNVYINGERFENSCTKGLTSPKGLKLPAKVPEGTVFVLGDNRENSRDSREIGFVPYESIKGKAVFRLWPVHSIGRID